MAAPDQVSNSKQLTVLIGTPDANAGWWIEAYDTTNVTRQVIDMTVLSGFFKPIMNSIGTGYIDVPQDDPSIDLLISPESKVTTLLRVYLDDLVRYVFFADNHSYTYDEEGNVSGSRIQGFGMEVVADRSVIGNADSPASPSFNSTWVYGSNENFVDNPSFEDNLVHLKNPGGEDGNTNNGEVEGWTKFGDEIVNAKSIKNSGSARSGEWYIEMDASDYHNGYKQSVAVTPGRNYHVWGYAKDPTAAGMRITMSLGGADDMVATGTYPENYEYKQKFYAELDNVARNPAKDGTPGGSTDGTWQRMDLEVTTGANQTSLEIAILSDHHGTFADVPFWIDDVDIEGWGLGLEPWTAFDPDQHATDSFQQDNGFAYDSSIVSCRISPIFRYAGIEQQLDLNPSTKYTASIWGLTPSVLAGDSWRLEMIANDGNGTLLGASPNKAPDGNGVWTNWQVVITTPADDQAVEVFFRYVYTGPNNPVEMYVDSASCVPGEPPGTAGKILNDVLVKIRARGELSSSWFQTSFDDVYDSRGRLWHAPLSMDIQPAETLAGVLDRMTALGHEWNIVPVNFEEGGGSGFMLNVYNSRGIDPDSGLGINWELQVSQPMIMPSDATVGGNISKNVNLPNRIFVGGSDGLWTVVEQDDFTAYEAAYGAISEWISAGSAVDQSTLAQYGASRLSELRDAEAMVQLAMQRSTSMRPFLTFGMGASIRIDMPPYFTIAEYQRIRSIGTTLSGEGTDINYAVDVSQVLYQDEAALFAKIAQLAERSPNDTQGRGAGRISGGGSGSTVVSGPATTTATPAPHKHALTSTDIFDKTLQGDVSGELPGPVSVNALKGIQFDRVIPTDDGSMTLLEYDRDAKQFVIGTLAASILNALNDLTDVNAPTPADEDILQWDAGASEYSLTRRRFDTDDDVNVLAEVSIASWVEAWVSDGYNGLFEWLGTIDGTETFVKPTDQSKVVTSQSTTVGAQTADRAIDQAFSFGTNDSQTTDVANSWWKVDFGAGNSFRVDRFGSVGVNFISDQRHIRIFRIEGSNDDTNWTTIIDVDGTIVTSAVGLGTWDSWVSQEVAPASWRYIRLLQYGLNAKSNNILNLGDVEMWGAYFAPTPDRIRTGDVVMFDGDRLVPYRLIEETTWQDPESPLVAKVSTRRLYADEDREIISVRASLDDAPSGGSATFDVNVDGVTVLDATKLVVADTLNLSPVAYPLVQTWAKDSYMTIDTDAASGAAGGATIVVRWRKVRP